jgi:Rod binding domain-containing protein
MKIQPGQSQALSQATAIRRTAVGKESLDAKKMRLRKATKEFESFFMLHMLRAMRKTIPENGLLDGGLGQDMYTSMFDEELSRMIAGTSRGSLSEVLYNSLEKHIEAQSPDKGITKPPIDTGLNNSREVQPVRNNASIRSASPVPIERNKRAESLSRVISKPRMKSDPVLEAYGDSIAAVSRKYNIDPRLVYSVIMTESNGRPDAVSPKGARGLMQLVDSTAAEMGVANSLDPHQNIEGGTKYLRQLLDRFDGDLRLALAAYNAGPGAVSKYNGVPPYPETEQYVEKVLAGLHSRVGP